LPGGAEYGLVIPLAFWMQMVRTLVSVAVGVLASIAGIWVATEHLPLWSRLAILGGFIFFALPTAWFWHSYRVHCRSCDWA